MHGWLWLALAALFAFLSMFRNPLLYFGRKALGLPGATLREELEHDRCRWPCALSG